MYGTLCILSTATRHHAASCQQRYGIHASLLRSVAYVINHCIAIHSCVLACLRRVAHTTALIVFLYNAGTQTAYGSNPTPTANNATAWTGSINLPIGYYNITLEYHSGTSGGTLILNAGYVGSSYQVSQSRYALDMLQLFTCVKTVQCFANSVIRQRFLCVCICTLHYF